MKGRGVSAPLPSLQGISGSRSVLRTAEHAETQKIAIWRPRPGDPLTMSHFGPPDSIRRRVGRPLSRGGAWPRFSGVATWAGRPFTKGGKQALSTASEVPSVTPVRGEGKFEGEGGFSAPSLPFKAKVAPGRWAAQGSLALRKAFLILRAPERGKQSFQYPSRRGMFKSPR